MKLEITDQQAKIITDALDCYSRMKTGQIDYALDPLRDRIFDKNISMSDVRNKADELKKLIFPEFDSSGMSYGIHSHDISDNARIAFDLIQVIRYDIWKREGGPKYIVDANPPYQTSLEVGLAKIIKNEES